MRTTEIVMVEQKITTHSCDNDNCDFSTTSNKGCCGQSPIMVCTFCQKDCCGKHREGFWENDWDDYYHDLMLCDDCAPRGRLAWEHAKETAGRYDSLREVTEEIFNNWNEYKNIIEGEI